MKDLSRRQILSASASLGLGIAFAPRAAAATTRTASASTAAPVNSRTGVPLRLRVDRDHPLHTSGFYGVDTVEQFWSAVPADLAANTALIAISGNRVSNDIPSVKEWITTQVEACQAHSIPVIVQALNGETHVSEHIPVSFWADLAAKNSMLVGLNAAELYNSIWNFGYGEAEGNHSEYLRSLFDLCGQTGMYFLWTDTNMRVWFENNFPNPPGTITDWLQDNTALLASMKANHENIILMNKESLGDADTDALFFGLWLAGYVDNWGSSADFWHWGINNHGAFPGGWGTQRWKDIIQYPSAYFGESILRVASQGGTAYFSEAGFGITSQSGHRIATYQYALIPLLNKIKSGQIRLPSRGEMLARVKAVYTRTAAFKVPYWSDWQTSNIIPSSGRYGILPLLPSDVPTGEASRLGHVLTTPMDDTYFDRLYPEETISSNDFMLKLKNMWFWMNTHENDLFTASTSFHPNQDPRTTVSIEATNHTFAVFSEDDGAIRVHLNNYRLDLTEVYTEVPPDQDLANPTQYILDRMTVQRDANGDVVTNAHGDVLTAGGHVLDDRSQRDVRTTTITVSGKKPTLRFEAPDPNHSRPYDQTQTWNASTRTLTVQITHNGSVDLTILL